MADVKWSDNAAFPEASSIDGTEELVGLKSGNNMKANIGTKLFPYIESNLLGSAINANFVSPSPANYTPTDSSITGNLRGIDAALGNLSKTPISQQLWVSFVDGNDSNNGDIDNPLKTLDQAIANAVIIATPTNMVLINVIGDQSGINSAILPNIIIDGTNSGTLTYTSSLLSDTVWQSLTSGLAIFKNCSFIIPSQINIDFGLGSQNIIYFENCNFSGVTTANFGANPTNTNGNAVIINGNNLTNIGLPFSSGVEVSDTELLVFNGAINNLNVVCSGTTGAAGASCTLTNSISTGVLFVTDLGTGATVNLTLQNSPMGNAPQLTGTNAFLISDVNSYNFIPTFVSGATIAQVTINSLTDGVLQTSYTPINYTPIGSSNYGSNSLTANLAGIDAALAGGGGGTPLSFTAKKSSSSTNVTGDGTPFTVIFDDVFSNNGLIYDNTTGVVTASVTGQYNFEFFIDQIIGGTHNNCDISLVTTSKTYSVVSVNPGTVKNVSSHIRLGGSVLADMSASDTAFVQLTISGGALDSGVYGDGTSTAFTYFSGYLVRATIGTEIIVANDNFTNATMYPVWVSGTSGAQDAFVSSNIFQFNPGAAPTITTAPTFSISNTGLVYSNLTSDTIGSVNEAGYKLYRGDQANGYAQIHYGTAGANEWSVGSRAGDVNYHIFNQGLDADVLFIDSSGNVNINSLSPNSLVATDGSKNLISVTKDAFSAYASAPQSNVTGAGAVYTVQFDTQAGTASPNFNTSTGTYTAPATGFYQFSSTTNVFNLDSGMTALKLSLLVNGTQVYIMACNNPFAGKDSFGDYTASGAITVAMNVGDIANITIEIDGGAGNNAGLYSSTNPIFTFFTGSQL